MKNYILTLVMLVLTTISYSQESPTEFKFHLEGDPIGLLGSPSVLNDYVVITYDTTTNETTNYQRVYNWILETYKNPDEVIVGQSENQFIKINGFASNLYYRGMMLASEDVRYSISFRFKDNKVKMELTSMESYTPPNYKANISGGWSTLNAIYVHKTNGQPKTAKARECVGVTDVMIEGYFNSLVYELTNYTTPTDNLIDDSDW